MLDVKPGQVWKVRPRGEEVWRPVRVVNVVLDIVELEYLDRCEVPMSEKIFAVDRSEMLTTASVYQFVARGPHERAYRQERAYRRQSQ